MELEPTIHTALFTSSELLTQPWLPDLTRMINESYLVSHTEKIKFSNNRIRLRSDFELSEELGVDGFTVVAFASNGIDQKVEVIGTASMKQWKDDGLWRPYNHDDPDPMEEKANDDVGHMLQKHACPGDFELAVVALVPGPRFRGKGIAGRLVKVCEEEVSRRKNVAGEVASPVRIMIRVAKKNAGDYWQKQGFTPVGSQTCPKGFWGAAEEFTMWAMIRLLPLS